MPVYEVTVAVPIRTVGYFRQVVEAADGAEAQAKALACATDVHLTLFDTPLCESDEQANQVWGEFEDPVVSPPHIEGCDFIRNEPLLPHACCHRAKALGCVCAYAYECPVHGETHVGTHD